MFRWRLTGIGYYSLFLIDALLREAPELEISGYDGFSFSPIRRDWLRNLTSQTRERAVRRQTTALRLLLSAPLAHRTYRLVKRRRYLKDLKKFDLFHALNFLPPWPTTGSVPCLPTVHDMSVVRHPETHPADRIRWLEPNLRWLAEQPLICTVSRFSASEIADVLGIDQKRVKVAYPGVNPSFSPEIEETDDATLQALGLHSRRYFLAVGTIEPRKNLAVLIRAFAGLPRPTRLEYPLSLVGPLGWGSWNDSSFRKLIAEGSVRLLEYQDEGVLAVLYRHARTLLFPSIYEGFGLPVAEAMASGLRPVVSGIPVLREIAGDAAIYIDPMNENAWREEISRQMDFGDATGLPGPDLHAIRQASAYRWDATARQVASVYHDLLSLAK
ncbi:MAG TPA: glycosyltransferase family 1 protein [Rhizobiaceae bacterium]|nr:glycosyltransferase family 1 protein [Rhizobiaceae bacterium]